HTPHPTPYSDWLYQVAWRPKTRLDRALPALTVDYMPIPQTITEEVQYQVSRLNNQYELTRYQPLGLELDKLSAAYVINAFVQLGWQPQLKQHISTNSTSKELNIVKEHQRLLGRMLEILQEEGILQKIGSKWQVCQELRGEDPEQIRQNLLREYPAFEAELTLLGRCGQQLAPVLKGECDPLDLLFPDGSSALVERLYQDSPVAQVINTLVQEAIAKALAQLPKQRPIRILEIGAGTGGTTSYILPKLPANQTEYVFTDVSTLFTAKARQKFHDYPFIQYQILDIERDPNQQGFAPHQFDIIVAANVLHATVNLSQTLNHVQQLLAPGGLLVLLEGTTPQRWMDLIFGLTEGWWRFADTELRTTHPLLHQTQWLNLLQQVGFEQGGAITAGEISQSLSGQTIILAQASHTLSENKITPSSPTPHSPLPTPSNLGSWLIFTDKTGVGEKLANQLKERGDRCILVSHGTTYKQVDPDSYQVNPTQPADFQRLLKEVSNSNPKSISVAAHSRSVAEGVSAIQNLKSVVHLWSLDATPPEETTAATLTEASILGCRSTLHLLQALVKAEFPQPPRLWLVTQGVQSVGNYAELGYDSEINHTLAVAQSPLWGLGGVAAREHPELWGGLVDLDNSTAEDQALMLLTQIEQPDGEEQIALLGRQRYVPRLIPHTNNQQPITNNQQLRNDRTYLITGGLGGLGLKVAQWMVHQGARYIVLVGRSNPSAAANELIAKLEQAGAKIIVKHVDVSQEEQVSNCLNYIRDSLPPLRGIIHGAGILDDGVLLHQNWEHFVKVLTPKVQGAWNLHTLTQDMELDFFVLFSSAASLLNPPGQANHASANRFLDTLAYYRQQQGLPALSINWGAWAEVGAAAKPDVGKRLMLQGVDTIAWEQGIEVLEELMQESAVQVGVLPIDWQTFIEQLPGGREAPFLSEVAISNPKSISVAAQSAIQNPKSLESQSQILEQLLELESVQREEFLRNYLQQQVAKALGIKGEVPCDRNVMDLGMDSLMVVEILNACKRDLQLALYPREFYERPQISLLAKYLVGEVQRAHGETKTIPSIKPAPAQDIEMWAWGDRQNVRTYTKPIKRNSPIAFVLSTPRAGSTLLRVMLAGHPALFSPPELHLLPFEGMAEWSEELGLSYLGEGLQRAFMELLDIDGNASKKLIEDLTQQDISIQNVYARLQELAGKRLLVDKSPSYAASMQTLERSEELFAGAKYIHLVRHPYAVIESFVRNRIDKILGIEEFDPHFVAEQIWVRINRNILEFGQQIDSSRYHLLRYEELVSDPATVMNGLCEFLEIPFDEAVLQPYEGKRMTDGVHPESLPINDPNFLKHNKIESSLGNVWKQIKLPQLLGEAAKQIAVELQYELPLEKQNGEKETENSSTNLTPLPTLHYPLPTPKKMQESYLNVRGLNLCLCSWGSEIAPLILCVHGILEHGAAWEGVANSLVNLGYRVVAPDQRGHGRSDHALMGGSYQLLDYLGDLDAIVPELTNQPFILMGHSMGSAVAATFASLRPDKVKQLVLVEPVLPAEVNDEEVATQLATHLDYLASPPQHPILTDVKIAAERLRQWTPLMSEELALKTATRLTEPCDGGVRWRWDSRLQIRTGLGFSGTVFNRTRYTQIVRQIQAPITLVYGDNSNFNKPEDLALQEAVMSQANRITLSGGHNLPIDAPEALATVIAQAARNIV
ncbi:MAG TPA: hypothetical protein DCL61_01955, partial [Cyanobacteria bacterium UBA12227]|nr:hypothetical protein [Cyanobacteria bacterium UBA12227]